MNKELKANYEWWNEAALLHAESAFYDVEGFLKGKSTLHAICNVILAWIRYLWRGWEPK